jgi:uncharacterized damage-inducible protein DinB
MDIRKTLEAYKMGYNDLQNALRELPMDMWYYNPSPGKWNIKEILVHIADSEINGYMRCRMIIAQSGSAITPYDQDKWAKNLNYLSASVDSNLELFRMLRVINYSLLNGLKDEVWDNYIIHPESGKMTLKDWLNIYTQHITIHINQMKRNYEAWKNSSDNPTSN